MIRQENQTVRRKYFSLSSFHQMQSAAKWAKGEVGQNPFFFFLVLFTTILTCAVRSRPRPSAVSQTLACGWAAEQISLHARVHDGVGERRAVHTGNTAVSGCCWVTALHRWETEERRDKEKVRGGKSYWPFFIFFQISGSQVEDQELETRSHDGFWRSQGA